ncbi:uncharacterized protein LOC106014100 [Aplysia californica]|uniref:Uncharacterized protein LOC106014100 n=1 Tax=Aplysia californica TaxID=6500 RepID=A0ABM1AFE0_APLCA|nr:uncharacterized protein LOC106014100 [Aplysia californica]
MYGGDVDGEDGEKEEEMYEQMGAELWGYSWDLPHGTARSYVSGHPSPAHSTSQLELAGLYRSGWGVWESGGSEESEEGSVSLPSSIYRFHAYNQLGADLLTSRYSLGRARTLSSQRGSVTSSVTADGRSDHTSVCPHLGSLTHSGSALTLSGSAPSEGEVFPSPAHNESLAQYLEVSADAQHESGMDNSGFVPDPDTQHFPPNERADESQARPESPWDPAHRHSSTQLLEDDRKLQGGGARQRAGSTDKARPLSDILRPGKVSTRERLHEFGFIKPVGHRKYVVNPSPGKFFRRTTSRRVAGKAWTRLRKSSVARRLNISGTPGGAGSGGVEGGGQERTLLLSEPRPVRGKPPRVPRSGALSA